jgi:hypothetical protein
MECAPQQLEKEPMRSNGGSPNSCSTSAVAGSFAKTTLRPRRHQFGQWIRATVHEDVVVYDLKMPSQGGLEVILEMKAMNSDQAAFNDWLH